MLGKNTLDIAAGGLMILLMAGAAHGQELGKLGPAKVATDLLGGRLRIRMPKNAKVEMRGHSIMAAPEALTEETRVMLDAGKERLVLMAWEMFALAGDDLAKAVLADIARSGEEAKGSRVEPLVVPKPLADAVLVFPAGHDPKREAVLLLSAYVESADGTVQLLAFYVNPAGAKDMAGCTALAKKLAGTLTAGEKKLNLAAGPRRFPGAGDKDFLVLEVPAGFVASTQTGPDFSVYRLRKVVVMGQPGSAVGIYLGGHPSYQHNQSGGGAKPALSKGKLLKQEVEWHNWSRGKLTTSEAILPMPGSGGLFLHTFLTAVKPADLAVLKTVIESLKIERKKPGE